MNHLRALGAALLGLTFLGASCGETNIEAIERLRPRGDAQRERLAQIAATLPEGAGETLTPPWAFSPALVVDFSRKEHSAEVLMEEQLRDPYVDLSPRLDLMLGADLLRCLMWTGKKNPLNRSAWNKSGKLGAECEAAFARRWLVVVRTVAYDLPERVELDVFVVDLERRTAVARFPVRLRGKYTREDIGRGRFKGFALSELRSEAWSAARCEVARRLASLPGAKVELRELWLGERRDPCAGYQAGTLPFRAVESASIAE